MASTREFYVDGKVMGFVEFKKLLQSYVSSLVNVDQMTWNEQCNILEENGHKILR